MSEAYIYDAVRTPRGKGKPDGSLHHVKPVDLLVTVLQALQTRNQFDSASVDDVVMGVVSPIAEQGAVISKLALVKAGWDAQCAGVQVNRFCASGLEAVNLAAQKVRSGWEDLVIAGGVESMSRVPIGADGGAWLEELNTAQSTGFAPSFVPQGIGADLIATLDGYTRADVDAFALESQRRAAHARAEGYFSRSLIPVKNASGMLLLAEDEFIKPHTTLEGLAQLKPAFEKIGAMKGVMSTTESEAHTKTDMSFDAIALARYAQVSSINHVHHAGNSSGIVDGAAAVLIGSAAAGKKLGLTARARIISASVSGAEHTIMLTGPMPAARKALSKANLHINQIDLFEINEAFSAVPMRFMREMGVAHARVNVNGGAIALGHPLGATGAMILGTLLDELERRQLRYGMATLCVGGGMGIATIIERL